MRTTFLRDYFKSAMDDTSTGSAGMLFPQIRQETLIAYDDEDREEVEKAEELQSI